MKKAFTYLLALLTAFVLMMAVRMLGVTIYTVGGTALEPALMAGDRLVVNRWSYGLRVGGKGRLFGYGRLLQQAVGRGDLVAFESPETGDVLVCRCTGLPGDTITLDGQPVVVPSLADCADGNYYWMESVCPESPVDSRRLGFVPEECIVGRAFTIVYSHDPACPLWMGWRRKRFLMPL